MARTRAHTHTCTHESSRTILAFRQTHIRNAGTRARARARARTHTHTHTHTQTHTQTTLQTFEVMLGYAFWRVS